MVCGKLYLDIGWIRMSKRRLHVFENYILIGCLANVRKYHTRFLVAQEIRF